MLGASQALLRPYTFAVGQPVRRSASIRDVPPRNFKRERGVPRNNDLELVDTTKLLVNFEHRGVAPVVTGRQSSGSAGFSGADTVAFVASYPAPVASSLVEREPHDLGLCRHP